MRLLVRGSTREKHPYEGGNSGKRGGGGESVKAWFSWLIERKGREREHRASTRTAQVALSVGAMMIRDDDRETEKLTLSKHFSNSRRDTVVTRERAIRFVNFFFFFPRFPFAPLLGQHSCVLHDIVAKDGTANKNPITDSRGARETKITDRVKMTIEGLVYTSTVERRSRSSSSSSSS